MTALLTIVAIVVLLLVVGELVARVLEPALPTHRLWHDPLPALHVQRMLDLRRREGRVDFVLTGSSVIHSGIDPVLVAEAAGLEWTGYNAGLHRGFYDMTIPWLTSTVVPLLRPHTAICLASVYDVNDNGPTMWEEPRKYHAALLGREDRIGAVARRLATASALFRHHRLVLRPMTVLRAIPHRFAGTAVVEVDMRSSRVSLGPRGEWTGFYGRSYLNTDAMLHHVRDGVLGDFVVGPKNLAIIERRLRELQAVVDRVVLTTVPVSDDVIAALPNGAADVERAEHALRAIADRLGIAFLDPDPDVTTAEDFADLAHLNEKGARTLSAALGSQLGALVRSRSTTMEGTR